MNKTPITIELIRDLPDKRAALRACVLFSGKPLKQIAYEIGVNDPGHLSKMLNPHADPRHFPQEKENLLMDVCGNEVPLLWSLLKRGYEPPATLEQLRAENARLQQENARLQGELEQLRREQRTVANIFKTIEVR